MPNRLCYIKWKIDGSEIEHSRFKPYTLSEATSLANFGNEIGFRAVHWVEGIVSGVILWGKNYREDKEKS